MNQVAAILVSQNGPIRSSTNAVDFTPQRGSAAANAPARCWRALRDGLRQLWRTQPSNAETAHVSWPVSPRSWRGWHHPPMLSFATGAHALVSYPCALTAARARPPRDPEARYIGEREPHESG
jgi:hypothetical protein